MSETRKVVINKCFGGFGLSDVAYLKLSEWYGIPIRKYSPEPFDPETGRFAKPAENEGEVIFDRELTGPEEDNLSAIYHRFKDSGVGAWVKPFASFKPNVNPGYCWEPVIFWGGRSASARGGRTVATVRDYCSEVITLKKGTSGAKPERFCFWLFDFLGANGGDEFADIFAGSGAVSRAWKTYALHNPAQEGAA